MQTQVKYLGFLISGQNIQSLEERIETLIKSKPPANKTELRSLIGRFNFYSRFISNYSKKLEPLRGLLTRYNDYQWRQYHQEASESLVNELHNAEAQTLAPKSTHKNIVVHIDRVSFETLLVDDNGKLIARCGKLLAANEANYSSTEKQLLALVHSVDKFKLMLDPARLTVKTPDRALEKVMQIVNRPDRVESLLLKMPPGFDEFDFVLNPKATVQESETKQNHIPQEIFYVDGACRLNGKPGCKASWAVRSEFDKEFQLTGLVEDNPSNHPLLPTVVNIRGGDSVLGLSIGTTGAVVFIGVILAEISRRLTGHAGAKSPYLYWRLGEHGFGFLLPRSAHPVRVGGAVLSATSP